MRFYEALAPVCEQMCDLKAMGMLCATSKRLRSIMYSKGFAAWYTAGKKACGLEYWPTNYDGDHRPNIWVLESETTPTPRYYAMIMLCPWLGVAIERVVPTLLGPKTLGCECTVHWMNLADDEATIAISATIRSDAGALLGALSKPVITTVSAWEEDTDWEAVPAGSIEPPPPPTPEEIALMIELKDWCPPAARDGRTLRSVIIVHDNLACALYIGSDTEAYFFSLRTREVLHTIYGDFGTNHILIRPGGIWVLNDDRLVFRGARPDLKAHRFSQPRQVALWAAARGDTERLLRCPDLRPMMADLCLMAMDHPSTLLALLDVGVHCAFWRVAIERNRVDIAAMLLARGLRPDVHCARAALTSTPQMARLMLDHGVPMGEEKLLAHSKTDDATIDVLIRAGMDVALPPEFASNRLRNAVRLDNMDYVRALLHHGAACTDALVETLETNNVEMARLLLGHPPADLLTHARPHTSPELLHLFINAGVPTMHNGVSVVMAWMMGRPGDYSALIHAIRPFTDLNAADGRTPLMQAVLHSDPVNIRALAECKADPAARDREGRGIGELAALRMGE